MRRCYSCQAKKSARSTIRWPLVSLPLCSRPGQMVSFDLLGPLPETKNGNVYVFLIDLFSRHTEGYAMIIYRDGGVVTPFYQIEVQSYLPG